MRPAWCASPRSSEEPIRRRTYTLGDDVLSQTDLVKVDGLWQAPQTHHLLYDGHGSTRQLLNHALLDVDPADGIPETPEVTASYSYDAYGAMLGGNPTSTPSTRLLYAGEHFDEHAQHYYNRARWYNPQTGRFNRLDPWAGSPEDPQSLHKYMYCHANPISGIDPSGMMSIVQTAVVSGIISGIMGMIVGGVGWGVRGAATGAITGFALGFLITGLVLYSGAALSGLLAAKLKIFISGATCSFALGSMATAYFINHTVRQMEKVESKRELLAYQLQLVFIIIGWAVSLGALVRHWTVNGPRFSQIRTMYRQNEALILEQNQQWIKEGVPLPERAARCHQMRQQARIQARELMGNEVEVKALRVRDRMTYDTPDGPSFEYLYKQAEQSGLTGDAVYQSIIDGSVRTSIEYNNAFSGE